MKAFDLGSEWAELNRAAMAHFDSLLPEVTRGKGVCLAGRSERLLLTRPMPDDAAECQERPLFRITSLDAEDQPLGHTVISQAQYRHARSNPERVDTSSRLADALRLIRATIRPDLTEGYVGLTLDEPTHFHYELRARDHGIGTTPKEGLVSAAGRSVVFDRPLSSDELKAFELRPVGARVLSMKLRPPSVPAPVAAVAGPAEPTP